MQWSSGSWRSEAFRQQIARKLALAGSWVVATYISDVNSRVSIKPKT